MSIRVSQILFERHGIQTFPGKKVKCPFCGHRTLSLTRDDSLAKCFHPQCGRFITSSNCSEPYRSVINGILEEIFHDFHAELLKLQSAEYQNAYNYLVKERGIHPQVVNDSMLGAVPSGYDLERHLAPIISELEAAIEAGKESHGNKRGRPRKNEGLSSEGQLKFIKEIRDKLHNCTAHCAGWLCFFYTDANHRIVSIRFRKPYTKQISYFKPFRTAGLFGHGLFTPYQSGEYEELNELLIVTEGEFNQLQLQSLCLQYGEFSGQKQGYHFACAVGGVNNTDYETILRVARNPIICYDNDIDSAGLALLENARKKTSVTAFTTPGPDSDLDGFIRSFGDDHEAAWEAVRKLVADRRFYTRDYEGLKSEIHAVRRKHGAGDRRKDFEINNQVASIVITDLLDRGKFYNDRYRAFYFDEVEKRLIEIEGDSDECRLMLANYGINFSEPIFRFLIAELQIKAKKDGTKTEIHRFAYYDPKKHTVYWDNNKNQMYRISCESIDLVDNGIDGVLFLHDPKAQPFELSEPDEFRSLLDEIIVSKINFAKDLLSPEERKIIFVIWFYSMFFGSIMPTKPIMAFIGATRSGKTTNLRKVGIVLIGNRFNVITLPNDVRDFDTAITNSHCVVFDNVDSKCVWLNDRLAIVATGGTIERRVLYTDNKKVEIPIHCFLGITSRTPHFRRDDVADRLLIMRVDKLIHLKAENSFLREVIQNRNQILTEVAYHLQEIVRILRESQDIDESSVFRIADFADFAIKISRSAGIEAEVNSIFEKLTGEQSSFILEDDPVFEWLLEWAKENPQVEVTHTELLNELSKLAANKGDKFSYKNNRSFAQHMRQLLPHLEEYFEISKRTAGGRKVRYSYRLKGDKNVEE